MITAAVLFDADITLRTVFRMRDKIIGSFAVIRAFSQPTFYGSAFVRRVIQTAAFETKSRITIGTDYPFGQSFVHFENNVAIRTDAKF